MPYGYQVKRIKGVHIKCNNWRMVCFWFFFVLLSQIHSQPFFAPLEAQDTHPFFGLHHLGAFVLWLPKGSDHGVRVFLTCPALVSQLWQWLRPSMDCNSCHVPFSMSPPLTLSFGDIISSTTFSALDSDGFTPLLSPEFLSNPHLVP